MNCNELTVCKGTTFSEHCSKFNLCFMIKKHKSIRETLHQAFRQHTFAKSALQKSGCFFLGENFFECQRKIIPPVWGG